MEMGEIINFGISHEKNTAGKSDTPLGKLDENETFTVPLNGINGVYAQCEDKALDTKVECFIESLQVNGLIPELEEIKKD